jgi:hypothetical protein
MCLCILMCVDIHSYICICVYMNPLRADVYMHMYAYEHIYEIYEEKMRVEKIAGIYIYLYMHIFTHKCIFIYIQKCVPLYIYTYINSCL